MPRGNQDNPPSPAIPFPSVDTIPPSNQNAPSQKIVILPVKRRIECCVETRMIPPPLCTLFRRPIRMHHRKKLFVNLFRHPIIMRHHNKLLCHSIPPPNHNAPSSEIIMSIYSADQSECAITINCYVNLFRRPVRMPHHKQLLCQSIPPTNQNASSQ